MTSTETGARFAASNGRTTGWLGIVLAGVGIVATLADGRHDSDPLVVALVLTGAVAIWLLVIRPFAQVRDERLELHHPFHVVRVPLASIDDVEVRMTMVVRTTDGRVTFSPISRSRRALVTGGTPDPLTNYPDLVEQQITSLAKDARDRGAAPGPVTRVLSPLPIGLMVGLLAVAGVLALI